MTILSAYAASTYKSTIVDPAEFGSPRPAPLSSSAHEETLDHEPPFDLDSDATTLSPSLAATRDVPHSSTPSGSSAATVRPGQIEISTAGVEDQAGAIELVQTRVRLNELGIERSKRVRNRLTETKRDQADLELERAVVYQRRTKLKKAIAAGADPSASWDSTKASKILTIAIHGFGDSGDENLCSLLEYGADPNALVASGDNGGLVSVLKQKPSEGNLMLQPVLCEAAWRGNEKAVWALVSAGARVNPDPVDVFCPECFGQAGEDAAFKSRRVCSTPLLRALTSSSWSDDQILRIVRFLLANGADPNEAGCQTCAMSPPLSTAIVFGGRSKSGLALLEAIFETLLQAGARPSFDHLLPDPPAGLENPFNALAHWGLVDMLKQLDITDFDPVLWKRAVCFAAANRRPSCVRMLLEKPYVQPDTLHFLVNDHLRAKKGQEVSYGALWDILCGDMASVARPTFDFERKVKFAYVKRGSGARVVTEIVSVTDLVTNIEASEGDRKRVRKLLEDPDTPAPLFERFRKRS